MTNTASPSTSEYELLTSKQKEQPGNIETATVQGVSVSKTHVNLSLDFDWTADSTQLIYDLDDERDVRNLEAVTAEHGFEFAQVGYLEELPVTVRYTSDGWVPTAHSVSERSRFSPKFLVEHVRTSVRRVVVRAKSLSVTQIIVGVILVKKLLVIAILVWLLL